MILRRTNTTYWTEDISPKNFGDLLTVYLMEKLFIEIDVLPGDVRVIESVLSDGFVELAVERHRCLLHNGQPYGHLLTAWACGLRHPKSLSKAALAKVDIRSVRGPLSSQCLGLPDETPFGDPAFLLPSLHLAKTNTTYAGKTVCVPHYSDTRSDEELICASGAEVILRPRLSGTIADIERFIDAVTSAGFILSGALHGVVTASAYGVPFAFWDSGDIDLPFKWEDFAASIGVPCTFVVDVKSAKTHYDRELKHRISIPSMLPSLATAPFPVRPAALVNTLLHEEKSGQIASRGALEHAQAIFQSANSVQTRISKDNRQFIDDLLHRVDASDMSSTSSKADAAGRSKGIVSKLLGR